MAAQVANEATQSLQCQTWNLKVSIHCEGCKRKVKRVFKNIEGVYTVTIDSQQQKVTVTGNISAETLIKKLAKTGKHAELWPEKADKKAKKSGKGKNNEKQNESVDADDQNTPSEATDEADPNSNTGQSKDSKSDGSNQQNSVAGNQSQGDGAVEKSGGGNGGKKKKNKGQKGNANVHPDGAATGATPAATASPVHVRGPASTPALDPTNIGPAFQHAGVHPHPTTYGHLPLYGVSYNTAYPSTSYGASYYAPPSPPYAYTYMHPASYAPPPEPSDSFESDDDEDTVGCWIM